ncbi:unnamed protein product [Phytophthora lilii]|uniref:Unnamed protein product n=1 Tax=Phytophthora lilii TaxID=2077276 RepID=A0A9W6UDV4_9STRA|nr:unnamed protein product [Phytophthora lilii]
MQQLSVRNCVDIYVGLAPLQMRAACRLLAQAARAMIDTFFGDVCRSAAFRRLPVDARLKVLRPDDELQPRDDVQSLAPARNSDDAMVNSKERLSLLDVQDVHAVDLLTSEIQETASLQLTPTIFVIGGFNNPGALNSVEYMDFHRGEWFPAAPMTTRRSYSGVAVTGDNHVFVIGGTSSSSQHHKTMERFDPETNVWTLMPSMKNARSYLGAAVVGEYIYAVGGFNGQAHLSSVERFDLRTQQWEDMPPLSTGRSGLAVVALNGLVYAIGGYDGRKHLKSVEVFDPQTKQWSCIASMRYARNGPAAVVQEHSNSIVVFGGESRHGARMNTSERLDLNSGTWSDVDAFVDCRSGHVAFSFLNESFLFCLGGSNKKDEYLDTVHRYDYLSKQWTLHSQMRAQRCGLNVAVVKTSPHAECFSAQKGEDLMYKQGYFCEKYDQLAQGA